MVKHGFVVLLALIFCVPAADAARDWGLISTSGNPDPITAFDLADPAGDQELLGFVDGNFNRGMDFDSPDSFYYYVSTDSLNDPGDRGLWRWDNGVNTQLYELPFSDSGDGDATLSNDLQKFYVTIDDDDAIDGDSLYVFGELNGAVTFTEIGETGLSQFIGIAMDPISGMLYGYDSGTESLYTISTDDATPTLVGASGESFGAIGGMDFNGDGSTLLFTYGGEMYLMDKMNGAVTAAGDADLNASALSYRIPEPASLALLALGGLVCLRRR